MTTVSKPMTSGLIKSHRVIHSENFLIDTIITFNNFLLYVPQPYRKSFLHSKLILPNVVTDKTQHRISSKQ